MNEVSATRSSDTRPTGKDAERIEETSSMVEAAVKTSLKVGVMVEAVQGKPVLGHKLQQIRQLLC